MTSVTDLPLVSPSWLAQKLTHPELLVLDIRSSESGGRATFEVGHVPGAVHSDYAADGWRVQRQGAGGLLPDPEDLADLLGRLGITPEQHVVIVSAGLTPADFSAAARVYWTLKVVGHEPVSILDGGYAGWVSTALPVETGQPATGAASPYPVRIDKVLRAELAGVEQAVRAGDATLLDGRSQAQFRGEEKSPQAARAGRLPKAIHLDHSLAFEPGSGRLRSANELAQLFEPLPDRATVSYCNTGHLASTNWFILSELLGRSNVSLYDGSMSEWTQDPSRPVMTGSDG